MSRLGALLLLAAVVLISGLSGYLVYSAAPGNSGPLVTQAPAVTVTRTQSPSTLTFSSPGQTTVQTTTQTVTSTSTSTSTRDVAGPTQSVTTTEVGTVKATVTSVETSTATTTVTSSSVVPTTVTTTETSTTSITSNQTVTITATRAGAVGGGAEGGGVAGGTGGGAVVGSGGGGGGGGGSPSSGGPLGGLGTTGSSVSGGGSGISISSSAGEITTATFVGAPTSGLPDGASAPFGWWDFQITGLTTGQTAEVTFTFPTAIPSNAVLYKSDCGSTPGVFNADNLVRSISGNTLTISLTDGGAGDCDNVSGQITDPGGIVVTDDPAQAPQGVPQFPFGTLAVLVVAVPLLLAVKKRIE